MKLFVWPAPTDPNNQQFRNTVKPYLQENYNWAAQTKSILQLQSQLLADDTGSGKFVLQNNATLNNPIINGGIFTDPIFGTVPNYSTFEADGTYVANGDATTWQDINLSGSSLATGSAAPGKVALDSSNILAYAFSGTNVTPDELHGSFEILHDYKEGTTIYPHVHWCPTTAGAGNVKWQLEYIWINGSGTFSSPTTVANTVSAGGVAWVEMRTPLPSTGISGSGKTMGSRFAFRLFRDAADAADTYAASAALLDIGIHYERDTLGSRTMTTK